MQAIQKQVQKKKTFPEKQKEVIEEISKTVLEGKTKKELKNLTLFLALLGSATLGRIALQHIPSVEPIIPLAIVAGLIFGMKEGFMLGGSAYIISNFFVWGLQGPWTIFQAIGAAVPGGLAGIYGKVRVPKAKDLILLSIAGTAFFEFLMNISGPIMGIALLGYFSLFSIPLYFITSLPFTLTHIISNVFFAGLFSPLLKLRRREDEFKMVSLSKLAGDQLTNIRLYKSRE